MSILALRAECFRQNAYLYAFRDAGTDFHQARPIVNSKAFNVVTR